MINLTMEPIKKNRWNKFALVGLSLSIIGFILPVLDVGSFILGLIALRQIKDTGERGKWLAVSSIILSFYLPLILLSTYLVYLRGKYSM